MSYRVHLRPDAETDIEEAAKWYEKQREGLGDEFLDEVLNALETVSDNPHMYAEVHRHTPAAP